MKIIITVITVIFVLGSPFTGSLRAQAKGSSTATSAPAPTASTADLAWANLNGEAMGGPGGGMEPVANLDLAARKEAQARHFAATVDLAKDFYTRHPRHAKAVEARKLEAIMLVRAVQSGDTSIEGRMEAVVESFCSDQSIPELQRAEVAGTHAFTGILRRNLKGKELSAAYEDTARRLIVLYPAQPQGYESLLAIAGGNETTKGRSLAQELVQMPAPATVKQNARLLVDRIDLVGTPLSQVLSDAGAKEAQAALQAGKPTIIYTWASWSPGSVALGEMLAKRKGATANIIGLNLDQDTAAAGELAKAHKLPGRLHYDNRSVQGALAKRLRVNGAPLVYFVDAQGVIRDVRGLDDLEQKLSQNGL